MARFESGVSGYVKAYAVVQVNFPIDSKGFADISCVRCPFLSANERTCQLNKEPVAHPHKYVGDRCPLQEIEEKGD